MKNTTDIYSFDNKFWTAIDCLIDSHKIIIDRPKGTVHPKFNDFIYNVDYGYLENTKSMDNNGIDIFVGSKKDKYADCIICTIDLLKNDCEIKLLLSFTDEEKQIIYQALNNNPYMKGIMIKRDIH
ncbi:MAG: inorganic pyrophosphatase [Clostridia bacterium]|nr:inorganic pyrophosphatase [Clostridia bacterium]